MTISFSSEPYFDDFSEDKHFHKIMFKPGYAVQARELNQIQSIIQNQISRHGQHIFKEGSMVIPGQISFDNELTYVKLKDKNTTGIATNVIVSDYVGRKVYGRTTQVVAEVIAASPGKNLNPPTLLLRFISSGLTDGSGNQYNKFISEEELTLDLSSTDSRNDLSVALDNVPSDYTGKASLVSIERGIYFTHGYFVQVEKQNLIVDAYSATPSVRIGLKVNHVTVSANEDESLLDNAQNTPNYAAPGADRYAIDLVLESRSLDSQDDKNFIELLRVEFGKIKKEIRSSEYSVLETTLARRTYDESGDYVVRDFKIDIREHRNNDRGEWSSSASKFYMLGDVVKKDDKYYVCVVAHNSTNDWGFDSSKWSEESYPWFNRGIYSPENGGDDNKLAIAVEPGKAYVQGYEIEKIATEYIALDKTRGESHENFVNEGLISYSLGSYIQAFDFSVGPFKLSSELTSNESLKLLDGSENVIGSVELISIERDEGSLVKMFVRNTTMEANKYVEEIRFIAMLNSTTIVAKARVGSSIAVEDNKYRIIGAADTSLIVPLPFYAIKDVITAETSYSIRKTYRNVGVVGSIATIASGGGTFASPGDITNYAVFDHNTGQLITSATFTIYGTICEINGLSGLSSIDVIATVIRTGQLRTKTLRRDGSLIVTDNIEATSKIVQLPSIDGYKLKSVKMHPTASFGDTGLVADDFTVDITERYDFDDGQRDYIYEKASIVLKGSFAAPSNPILIQYEYFEHGVGDYFSVNSYSIDYKDIPYYVNTPLRDCLDFRSSNGISSVLKRGKEIFADFTHYVSRKSKLIMDASGKLNIIDSKPALEPVEPADVSQTMTLASIALNPYVFDTTENSVIVSKNDNRRYTMRDIGKLESRIENLEYYTTLSLLEQDTKNIDVVDSLGESRMKNGFIVDSFSGHGIGDTENQDYRCSVDMENGVCRPFFTMSNVNLVEKDSTRSTYNMHGDLITLPIQSHVPFINQPYGSRTENVNPFAVYTFIGTLTINPSSDDWFETDRKPDIVNNIDGNFNTIKSLAENTGVLGTVWNSWQTTWTGTPRVVGTQNIGGALQLGQVNQNAFNARFGRGADNRPAHVRGSARHGTRSITLETTATNSIQSRSGVSTSVAAKIEKEVVSDRVLNAALIPFIRSRYVLVKAQGLKPNTRYYAFFDDINIINEIDTRTIKVIEYTPINNKQFDSDTNAGSAAKNDTARHINNDAAVCLNVGDVIRTTVDNITAVVVGKHTATTPSGIKHYLRIANQSDTLNSNHIFSGSISGATGKFVQYGTSYDQGVLMSNELGELEVLWKIPNKESLRFRTGKREFKLADTPTGTNATTSGTVTYSATGIIETKQATVNAIRNAEIVRSNVNESRSIVQRNDRVVSDTGWYDPLAQTFLVESKGGAFLTKVDLFFAAKDDAIPVTIEIREVVNGYPGKTVLPFSRVVKKASDVRLSSKIVSVENNKYPKYDTPTTFDFINPVYLNDGQEYCLVILSDSNKYRVWISQMGDTIPESDRTISSQPYNGVLFKSQNASTWTADQYQDLMFTLYKAKFDTSVVGNVEFVNDNVDRVILDENPFHMKTEKTLMRVFHKDHGFKVGDVVRFSGVTNTGDISSSRFVDKDFIVLSSVIDSYVISIGDILNISPVISPSTIKSGYFGGNAVYATRNVKYSAIQPNIQIQNFADTKVACELKQTAYDSGTLEFSYSPAVLNDTNRLNYTCVVKYGESDSVFTKLVMTSSNENVSPIIDTHRTSLVLIDNKINLPTVDNTNVGGFDDNLTDSFYIPDSKNGATTYSAYITRSIKLLSNSSMLNVRFAANIPSGSDIEVYYRCVLGESSTLINKEWNLADVVSKQFVEDGNESYIDVEFSKELSAEQFNVVQVKIAFKSLNSAIVPKIKDLRVLALL